METTNQPSPHDHRTKTDKSLKTEREQTDTFLERKSQEIENKTDKTIEVDREIVDKHLQNNRIENDNEPTSDHTQLHQERKQTDKALGLAQEKQDAILDNERKQKQIIIKDKLENERKTTDSNLDNERTETDTASQEGLVQLTKTKNALDLRNQFLAMVSHDLKNPLAAVLISVNLVKRLMTSKSIDQDKILHCLHIIEQSSSTMDRMINDLLDVERIANNKLVIKSEPYDICLLLQECIDVFSPLAASKTFTITLDSCPKSAQLPLDHDRIVQVVSNLINNALKFTSTPGIIRLSAKKESDHIAVSVSDNGPGIPDEKRQEIFERFAQLHGKDRRGLGLGLFISKWIVEEHHGRISVASNADKGSVFTFTLPLA